MQEATLLLSLVAGALMTSLVDDVTADRRRTDGYHAGGQVESEEEATAQCPRVCFCNSPSHIVYCSRRGLPFYLLVINNT